MNERERNRREFPEAAAFVDRMRSVFGPSVRLRWWVENGKSIGAVPEEMVRHFQQQQHEGTVGGSCQIASSGTSS